MKPVCNALVAEAWALGQEARNHNNSFYTDGKRIYSYGVTIGFNMAGRSFVIDYTSTGGHYISQTTSTHVNRIKREPGVKTISAEEYQEGFHHLVRDL